MVRALQCDGVAFILVVFEPGGGGRAMRFRDPGLYELSCNR